MLSFSLQLDSNKQTCVLTELGCHSVMATLLAELLFLHEDEYPTVDEDLPQLFQYHFSLPLPLSALQVDSPTAMLALPKISTAVQVWH